MAYVGGLYTGASQAAAAEAQRFREFQTQIDEMGARERAGLYRRDQAAMDQFTAGLKPQSNIATPDWTMPAAPPMAGLPVPKTGGGADSGAAAQSNYERDRLMQERRLLESQFNSEIGAQKTIIDDLGRRKYILEQQLSVAPAYQQQAIRDQLTMLNSGINNTVTGTRARVQSFNTLFKDIDEAIRTGDYNRSIMSGSLPAAPDRYTPGALPDGDTAMPGGMGAKGQPIPVPDSLGMPLDPAAPAAAQPAPGTPAPGTPAAGTAAGTPRFAGGYTPLPAIDTRPIEEQYSEFNVRSGDAAAYDAALKKQKFDRITQYLTKPRTLGGVIYENFIGTAANSRTAVQDRKFQQEMADWYKSNKDAIVGNPATLEEASKNPLAFFKQYNPDAAVPPGVEAAFTLIGATEQTSAQEGKGDIQTAGMTPPSTAEAAAAAVPALQATADVPIGDPADPRVAAITQYSAQSIAERAPALVSNIGTAVTSDSGQEIISRATALGVDPAAAIAIYGLESSFGAKGGTSGAGAGGPLQVMPAQVNNLKAWFTNGRNIAQYNIPREVVDAAKSLTASSVDAGLLQLKYNELIGLPKNLWGAGYQADATKVREAGTPLPVHDAGAGTQGLTNSDYNKLYVTLYNEARGIVNIPPSTTTSQEGVIGNSQAIRQLDAQEQQITSDFTFVTQTLSAEAQTNLAKRQEIERQIRVAQQFGDRAAYDKAVADLETLANLDRDINIKLRTAETQTRVEMDKINLARTNEYINMAVMELDGGNVEPFADMVSRGTGMLVEIAPIEGGKFAVYQNNQLISGKGYTLKQLKDRYLSPISAAYEAQRTAIAEEERKFNSEALKEELKLARDMTLEEAKAMAVQKGWTEGKEATDANTGAITERWYSKTENGKLRTIRMRIAPDREENGLRVKGGVVVEEVGGIK